ncbi:C40 family peptidase [Streptomyces sp. uw30]|uniref:C40 family peptidase n=1 Tax=Streptomyces sp. uw30 TaxID=1828179 RepID=UPI0021C61646|nr:C40 family peptidase [Streptomyces sp. uw30]
MRNSAFASAALTSVALLGQTAGAAPSSADEAPSREEVSRRVTSLYDRAETDSGTFNATRASSTGPRGRDARPEGAGPASAVGARASDIGRDDPALDSVTQQWFDLARAKRGPTVPAVLPRDRTPDRPAARRPARATQDLAPARELSGRAPLELTAAPAAELTSAPAAGRAAVAELTAGPVAALPPAPAAPQGDVQATQVLPAVPALPASTAPGFPAAPAVAPAADPQQRSGLRTTKEQSRRKLDRARELLSVYAMRQSAPPTAVAALPAADTWSATPAQPQALPSADDQWQALQAQSAADLTTVPPGAAAWPTSPTALETDTFAIPATDPIVGTTTAAPPATAISTALTATGSQDTRALRALEFARAQLGKPCVWGTTGPEAFDGPGLTQAAWKAAGITLPRTAPEQATAGQGIALTYVDPGDLVLFHAGHVGIYSGNGMMIHAPGPGALIREESIHYAGEAAIHSVIRPA